MVDTDYVVDADCSSVLYTAAVLKSGRNLVRCLDCLGRYNSDSRGPNSQDAHQHRRGYLDSLLVVEDTEWAYFVEWDRTTQVEVVVRVDLVAGMWVAVRSYYNRSMCFVRNSRNLDVEDRCCFASSASAHGPCRSFCNTYRSAMTIAA